MIHRGFIAGGYYGGQNVREKQPVDQEQQSRWRPSRGQVVWTSGIVAALIVSILIGYRYGITLWEWMKLLVVPAVLAGGGLWFNRQQQERQREDNRQRQERELELAERRSQDEALQAYLDGMSQLLTDKDRPLHRAQVGDSLSTVARARTLTVLTRLSSERKGSVVQFLYEAGLIFGERPILDLSIANLSEAHLSRAKLSYADLVECNLSNANLKDADLWGANLEAANLSGAYLRGAVLQGANLARANLSNANLQAVDLTEANLSDANLQGADLTEAKSHLFEAEEVPPHAAYLFGAELRGANLARANLSGVQVDTLTLDQKASSLEGATMPNGQKYEDWLKDKESRGENGEKE